MKKSQTAELLREDSTTPVEPTAITFSVVPVDEAKQWIPNRRFSGRFGPLKESLMMELKKVQMNQALSLPVPENLEKKEIIALMSAINHAIKMTGLSFVTRYSRTQRKIVVIRSVSLPKVQSKTKKAVS